MGRRILELILSPFYVDKMKNLTLVSILLLSGMICSASRSQDAPDPAPDVMIDLSHSFDSTTIHWPTVQGFKLHETVKGWQEPGYYYEANSFEMAEHTGTHMDAPIHFAEGKWSAHEIPLENLVGPGVVVDVSDQVAENRDYQISVADLKLWEAEHGRLPNGAMVLFRTGFGEYWPDPVKYMDTDLLGLEALPHLDFPGIGADAARWLRDERSVDAVGIDTASLDYGQSDTYESHQELFQGNIIGFENLANLDKLPPKGFTIIALPMKIKGGSGGPVRIIAMMHN